MRLGEGSLTTKGLSNTIKVKDIPAQWPLWLNGHFSPSTNIPFFY